MTNRAKRNAILNILLFGLLGVYFCYAGVRSVGFARVILLLIGLLHFAIVYNYVRGLRGER